MRLWTLWPFLAAVLYLVLPGHPLSALPGRPLTPLGLSVLVLVVLLLFAVWPVSLTSGARRVGVVFSALCVARVALALLSPDYGLEASYFADARTDRSPERSTESPRHSATRVDLSLDFEGSRFPVYFFNDNQRFNYYKPDEPQRDTLPFAVRWRGWLQGPDRSKQVRIWLTAIGSAVVTIGGQPDVRTVSPQRAETVSGLLDLEPGWQPIEVEYVRLGGDQALLRLDSDLSGRREPVSAPAVVATRSAVEDGLLQLLGLLAWLLDGLYLVASAVLGVVSLRAARLRRAHGRPSVDERCLLALVLLGFYAYAAWTSLPLHGSVTLLDGGADWLTYETYARDIQLNGPLMTLGRPLGSGRPYFFQPFYPYYLAALHWLTGEGLFGVVVLQLFGQAVAAVLLYFLARRLLAGSPAVGAQDGFWTSWLALATMLGLLFPLLFEWVGRHLLSENLYFWLLPAAALALLELLDRPASGPAVMAGVLLGLCSITRAPTLLWLPPALLVVALELRRRGTRAGATARALALCIAVCGVIVALVPARNYVVSGRPSLTATNAGATMALAHPLTEVVRTGRIRDNAVYNALNLDQPTREVLEFIRQDPLGYLATLPPLALYSVGLSYALEGEQGVRYELLAVCALYVASFALPAVRAGPVWMLHSFVFLHLAIMTVFLPNSYGYRQVLPMYLFVVPFAAYALTSGLARLTTRRAEPLPAPRPSQG